MVATNPRYFYRLVMVDDDYGVFLDTYGEVEWDYKVAIAHSSGLTERFNRLEDAFRWTKGTHGPS